MQKILSVSIENLIDLYEIKGENKSKHVSSISGIIGEDLTTGLLVHYLENELNMNAEIIDIAPSLGQKKGHRLDRWVYAIDKLNDIKVIYQIEIKNWSLHYTGFGGALKTNYNNEDLIRIAHKTFKKIWDTNLNSFNKSYGSGLSKILIRMKPPELYSNIQICPIICFSVPILPVSQSSLEHENGLFKIQLNEQSDFDSLLFFSVSIYLRHLIKKNPLIRTLDLEMKNAYDRIGYLKKIIHY